jgi:hypothetical protein
MRLVLKNKIEFTISEVEAKKIQQLLDDGEVQFIHLGKQSIDRKMIAGIFEGGFTERDLPGFNQIEEPRHNCVNNRTSIQVEVHKRILKINGGKTTTALGDKVLREKIRQKIIAEDSNRIWCDNKKGTHACVENKTV